MKTQGVEVAFSNLLHTGEGFVPAAFWARVKFAANQDGVLAELEREERQDNDSTDRVAGRWDRERLRFKRWVTRLYGPQVELGPYGEVRWPWSSGWTEEDVDEYLRTRNKRPLPRGTGEGAKADGAGVTRK